MTLSQTLLNTFVTVTQCLSGSRQQQQECLLFNPLGLSVNSSVGVWTQLSDAFVLLRGSAGVRVDWLICCDTLRAWWNDGGLSARWIYRRMSLSVPLAVTSGPPNLSCLLSVLWSVLRSYTAVTLQPSSCRSDAGSVPAGKKVIIKAMGKTSKSFGCLALSPPFAHIRTSCTVQGMSNLCPEAFLH